MWGKLQALRDYHTASEDQGKHSTAIFLLRGCRRTGQVLASDNSVAIFCMAHFLLAAEEQGVEQALKAPILATCEVADIVEAVKTLQVALTLQECLCKLDAWKSKSKIILLRL